MAAAQENLLSPGHLTGTERNTFPKQREHSLKKSANRPLLMHSDLTTLRSDQRLSVMHLQQYWQELKEREVVAQQHNRQLLLQFEKAQDTLTEMLTLTAAMKTIRMEYERYLDESAPRWQQQLKVKTQAAQRKKMEEYLKSCSKNRDDAGTNSSSERPLSSPGATTKPPQKPPTENSHYNQDGFPHLSSMQSSWQTHPNPRAPHHPHIPPSYLSQSFLPPAAFPHLFQLHHLASTPTPRPPLPGQHPPGWVPTQLDSSWAWTSGIFPGPEALWGQLCAEGPSPERGVTQVVRGEVEVSRAGSSKRDRGAGSGSLSQELDTKPVRLSSAPAESSESSMESSQSRRERRKRRAKTGSSRRSCSDRDSSQESSRTSSVIITAAVRAAQSSESDSPSEKSKSTPGRQRSAGLAVGSPTAEKALKEKQPSNGEDSGSNNEESRSTMEESRSEEAEKQSPEDQAGSCREESGSQGEERSGSIPKAAGEIEQEESSCSEGQDEEDEHELEAGAEVDDSEEQDSGEDEEQEEGDEEKDSLKDEENMEGNKEEKEDSQGDEEQEEEDEDDEKEEDGESEEEQSDRLKDEDAVKREQSPLSSQDEEVDEEESEGDDDVEDELESDEEESDEEQQMRDKVEVAEERDSEDSIISPQKKSDRMLSIPEEGSDEEQSAADDADEFSDEDIEHLLAPQEQSQEKQLEASRAEEKPTALRDEVEPFQMETDKAAKTIHLSDAEEFDDFYD